MIFSRITGSLLGGAAFVSLVACGRSDDASAAHVQIQNDFNDPQIIGF